MNTLKITPLDLALRVNFTPIDETPYNWETQTRCFDAKQAMINASTMLNDTRVKVYCGKIMPTLDGETSD